MAITSKRPRFYYTSLGAAEGSITSWDGWVWPVPIWEDRIPLVTQEWKPGSDPTPGEASGEFANHLGVDIMFSKLPTDPAGAVLHDAIGPYIAPEGTPIIAAGPGTIWGSGETPIYGKWIQIDHPQGVETFYQHLSSFDRPWQKGDKVEAGTILGKMGYAPGDPEGLRHLHFELWWPVAGTDANSWRRNPAPYLAQWPKVQVSQLDAAVQGVAYMLGSVGPVPILPVLGLGLAYYLWTRYF